MNKILLNIALLIVLAALIMILFPTTDQERSIKQTEVSIPETSKHVRIATNIQNENMIDPAMY